jgi:hypothetical protein
MKSYKQFCEDANIQEFWNPLAPKVSPSKPQPVLAYKNYQQGFGKGKDWKPGKWNSEQEKRYGWKPVKASVYAPGDRFTPNKVTATGEPHNWTTRNAAVPFKYKEGQAPKGKEGKPSIPYGSRLDLTAKPMGKDTKSTSAKINDVGDFGKTGNVNKDVSFDVSPQITKDIAGNATTPEKWGKKTVYTRVTQPEVANAKVAPKRK